MTLGTAAIGYGIIKVDTLIRGLQVMQQSGEESSSDEGATGEKGSESSYTDKPGKIAKETGKTVKEVKNAIHRVKDGMGRNTDIRNPNVKVDPKTGDVRPIGPDGSLGDSIGNIFDFL